jgi:RimJ/RimL family protein N-acetyltransferase
MNNETDVYLDVAHQEDAAAILAMLRLLQVESDTFTISPEFATLTVDTEATNIAQIEQTTDNLILIAWLDQTPIGIVTVSRVPNATVGELGIAVRKAYWHQGLGTALMQEALNWGQHYSTLDGLMLEVLASNQHAIQLYQKTGFELMTEIIINRDQVQLPALKMEIKF